MICVYKMVRCKFRWWGIQTKAENTIMDSEKNVFTLFHRRVFCWLHEWIDLTMKDIRELEDKAQKALEERRKRKL